MIMIPEERFLLSGKSCLVNRSWHKAVDTISGTRVTPAALALQGYICTMCC